MSKMVTLLTKTPTYAPGFLVRCTLLFMSNTWSYFSGYRNEFLKALNGLGPSSTRGYYINSCYAHCQTGTQETWLRDDSPRLASTTIAKAVGDWFYDRNRFQEIDCPYPCDKTCKNRNFESDVQPVDMDL